MQVTTGNTHYFASTDDDPSVSPALEYDYRFRFFALLSSGPRGFKRFRSYIIIIHPDSEFSE